MAWSHPFFHSSQSQQQMRTASEVHTPPHRLLLPSMTFSSLLARWWNGWPSQGYSPVLASAWKRNSLAISSPRCCALDDDLSTWELETEAFNSCVSTIAGLNPVVASAWKRNSLAISSPRKRPHVALWMTTCRLESLRPKHYTCLEAELISDFFSKEETSCCALDDDLSTWELETEAFNSCAAHKETP